MARNVTAASPADVRLWARESGLTVGGRGRFAPSLVDAFNKAHGGKGGSSMRYTEATFSPVEKVTVRVEGKRAPVTRNIDLKAARKFAVEQGLSSPTARGPLSAAVKSAYAVSLSS